MSCSAVQYHPETIPAFKGNPIIECLPPRVEMSEIIKELADRPDYSEEDRTGSPEDRGMLVQNLLRLYQPCEKDIDIYNKVERCIRWGYADRNPFSPQFVQQRQLEFAAQNRGEGFVQYTQTYHTTNGFALLGISGLGKSTTLRHVLGRYPQVIRHKRYHDIPFNETQITWIHMDCPEDGSLKGLCAGFLEQVDNLLGTDYFFQYAEKKATLNKMRIAMARIARNYHLGVIVIDEIQNLCVAKDQSIPIKTLNFLVTLVNSIGVPVILVGTPRALAFLQKEFQQAKRACGQGDALWEHMQNDSVWRMFVTAIWKYQYTKHRVELTDKMVDALFEEAVGIPFLAVNIYKLVQEYAIYSGEETFTPQSFHTIASQKMKLTLEMRRSLLSGKDINLQQYLDLTPFRADDFKQTITQQINPPEPDAPVPVSKPDLREMAVQALLAFGLDRPRAMNHVNRTLARFPGCSHSSVLAREAYDDFLQNQGTETNAPVPAKKVLTGNYTDILSSGFIGI
ncbi:MAG: ATP-binding protein [Clostridia bacterium]|nr:ATP-binding protein [Clostridia bacterium]